MSSPAPDLISATVRPVRPEGVLAQEAQGRTVLLRMSDGSYYSLDDVGAAVWELSDGERTVEGVIAGVCELFDAPADEIAADVREFITELRDEQLLHLEP